MASVRIPSRTAIRQQIDGGCGGTRCRLQTVPCATTNRFRTTDSPPATLLALPGSWTFRRCRPPSTAPSGLAEHPVRQQHQRTQQLQSRKHTQPLQCLDHYHFESAANGTAEPRRSSCNSYSSWQVAATATAVPSIEQAASGSGSQQTAQTPRDNYNGEWCRLDGASATVLQAL
jgi:hypothetical protein